MFVGYGVLNYWTYLVGAISIVSMPRPDTLFILKNSVSSDTKGGYLATYGVLIGDAVLMFLTWTEVAALIKTTLILFNIVRYLGAFYLSYLGSKILYVTLKGRDSETKSDEPQYGAIFKRVLILSLTNPKAILSYASFFIQFIDVSAPHTGISFFILATTLELVSFCCLSFLIISGVLIMQCIRIKKKLAKVGNSLIGLTFVGSVTRLAMLQS